MKIQALIAGVALALTTSFALAAGEGWEIDFEAAKAKAAKEKKDLLVDFTGSDWCGWCIKLNKEVFSHEPFKKGVADTFVLVELDYPNDKSKLSKETIKQNEELKDKFAIRGFPTILLMDAEGRPFAQTGYQAGGPEKYVAHLNELREVRAKRDAAMAKAAKQEGVEKAKTLVEALSGLNPDLIPVHYSAVTDEIAKLDPKDETGFVAKQKRKKAMDDFQKEIGQLFQSGKLDGVPAKVDKFIAEQKLEGEEKQSLLGMKIDVSVRAGDFDGAEKILDEIVAVDPKSRFAKMVERFRPRLAQMKAESGKPAKAPPAPEK